jgi:hypothetical protein
MDKCAYRYTVEEYITCNRTIPEDLSECERCSGYPVKTGCVHYTTLEHLAMFSSYNLDKEKELVVR